VYCAEWTEARSDISGRLQRSVAYQQHDACRRRLQRLRAPFPCQRQTRRHEERDARRRCTLRRRRPYVIIVVILLPIDRALRFSGVAPGLSALGAEAVKCAPSKSIICGTWQQKIAPHVYCEGYFCMTHSLNFILLCFLILSHKIVLVRHFCAPSLAAPGVTAPPSAAFSYATAANRCRQLKLNDVEISMDISMDIDRPYPRQPCYYIGKLNDLLVLLLSYAV